MIRYFFPNIIENIKVLFWSEKIETDKNDIVEKLVWRHDLS
jgi:hypothetical protein